MDRLLDRLYRTKLRFAGLVSAVLGIGLLLVSGATPSSPAWRWLVGWPTDEVGTTLLSAGVIATIFEYYARKEADERTDQHLRQAIRHEAPVIRDAVLDSFAFQPETMRNIASSDTLDRIATNAIGLRLGDNGSPPRRTPTCGIRSFTRLSAGGTSMSSCRSLPGQPAPPPARAQCSLPRSGGSIR